MPDIPPENLCAWCGRFIDENMEILALGARLPGGVDMKKQEGQIIFLGLTGNKNKTPALVTHSDSPAKKNGSDLALMTCGNKCFNQLKGSMEKEKDLFDIKQL